MFVASAPDYAALRREAGPRRRGQAGARARSTQDGRRRARSTAGTASGSCAPTTSSATRSAARRTRRARSSSSRRASASWPASASRTGQAQKALDSVKERLDTPVRHRAAATRRTPSTTSSSARSRSYPPGYKENAGIFCHNNPWIMIAETVIGRGDRAFDYYKRITPGLPRGHQRGPPHRALRLRADDRRQGRRPPRRGQELVADRHGGLELRGHLAVHARRPPRVRRPAASIPASARRSPSSPSRRKCRGAEYRIHVKNSGKGGPPS